MGRAPHQGAFAFDNTADLEIAIRAMELTEVEHLGERFVNELSGGELQRVIIARALAQQPSLLLLDEPTAFLDLRHQVQLFRLLVQLHAEQKLTVVVASHDINLSAQFCKRLLLLDKGRLVTQGKPEEVLQPKTIDTVYRVRSIILKHPETGRPVCLVE